MISKIDKNADRVKRHARVRAKISGTPERPRLSVYRSLVHIYAQIIDDVAGNTLVAASTLEKDIAKLVEGKNAEEVASLLKGNTCGPRNTSCADQLAKAILKAMNE